MDNFTIINKTTLLLGKRNSGKSQMLRYLLQKFKSKISKTFVICPTEEVNNFYSDIVPVENIFPQYNEEWVKALISKTTKQMKNKKEGESPKQVVLILDDCIADTNFKSSETLKILFARGRHIFISILITSQYLNSIPPIARNNCDWVLCSQMNAKSKEILADEFIQGDISKQEFEKMLIRATKSYSFLLINNNSVEDASNLDQIYGSVKVPEAELKKM